MLTSCGIPSTVPINGVEYNWYRRRVVVRKLGRTNKRDRCTRHFRNRGDLRAIRRNDHLLEQTALQSCLDGPRNHRLTTEVAYIFLRNAFAAAAGRDDAGIHVRRDRGFLSGGRVHELV